ncbi:MAG: alpha/beta fold hydrolase [Waterburya sp.]
MDSQINQEFQIEIRELTANGMSFRCRVCGMNNNGESVILLHGFPETSHMWEGVLQFLASQGYRCLAPDQRGYSPGARPQAVNSYRIDEIASDIVALADAVGFQKFHLVGHDWGAGCGWTVIQFYSDRVNTFSALSVPHLAAFRTAKNTDPEQKRRSWYIDFFQLPLIPEILFSMIIAIAPSRFWSHSTESEVAEYVSVFRQFDALQGMINWYRANQNFDLEYGDVFVTTTMIWGNKDIAIARAGVKMTEQYMKGDYKFIELDAGHNLVQEQFEPVTQAILERLQGVSNTNTIED